MGVFVDLSERMNVMSVSPQLKKLAIFGLLPKQQRLIEAEHGQNFDLSFNKDALGAATRSIVRAADSVILMTRFLSHRQAKTIDKSKCLYCNGGMSALRQMLAGLSQEKPAEEKVTAYIEQRPSNTKVKIHVAYKQRRMKKRK